MTSPSISILCATRNRTSTLRRALKSIHQQTLRDYEVLVLDDGSDDQTMAEYSALWSELDERFVLHRIRPAGAKGGGPSQARNHGIRLAKGEFVGFLDDDDWWTSPDHLEVAITAMRAANADYYFTNMIGVRDDEPLVPDWYPDSPQLVVGAVVHDTPRVHEVSLRDFLDVMSHHFVHPDNSIVRRDLLAEVGGFFERVIFAEDYDLMMRIADRCGRILYRPDPVARYRLPVGDSSSSTESRQDQTLQVLFCAQHVRLKAERPLVRRCARAREGWTQRELAQTLQEQGRPVAALSFAWQAIWTYPTFGAGACLLKALFRAMLPARHPAPAPQI